MQVPNEIIKTGIAIDEKYFDLRGLAEYSSLGVSSLRYHIRENGLPVYCIRNDDGKVTKVLIKRSEFDRWMESRWNDHLDKIVDSAIEEISK